jgi:hypothetical protein
MVPSIMAWIASNAGWPRTFPMDVTMKSASRRPEYACGVHREALGSKEAEGDQNFRAELS